MKTIARLVAVNAILALALGGVPRPLSGAPVAYCPIYRFFYKDNPTTPKTCYCKVGNCTVYDDYPVECNTNECKMAAGYESGRIFYPNA